MPHARRTPQPDLATRLRQSDLLESVGNTPLLRLRRVPPPVKGAELWAKAEWWNPGGSVKDRAALGIVRDAVSTGALAAGRTLVDASSGNTGISYAMLGARLGFEVHLFVPNNVGVERRRLLAAYGARVTWTDALHGMDGAIDAARAWAGRRVRTTFYADQYSHDANWRAHFEGTAREILTQTSGRLTHFIAGLGTTGTFVGSVRRLRQEGCAARAIACIPDSPYHGLEGWKHLPSAHTPGIWDARLADEMLEVRTEDAFAMVRALAAREGLCVGPSGAAAVVGACRVIERDGPGVYVTVLPDSGLKYLSQAEVYGDARASVHAVREGPR